MRSHRRPYSDRDVCVLADELGVDRAVALDRVRDWQHALRAITSPLADERLASSDGGHLRRRVGWSWTITDAPAAIKLIALHGIRRAQARVRRRSSSCYMVGGTHPARSQAAVASLGSCNDD